MRFSNRLWPALLACLVGACGSSSRPPQIGDTDAGFVPPAVPPRDTDACVADATITLAPDAQGLCGSAFLQATSDPPNLYFVIDRSGSMQELVGGRQKYAAVAKAAVGLVRSFGSQVNVGAALFPGRNTDQTDSCVAGQEVFTTKPGDAPQACGQDGPVTSTFSRSLSLVPSGATPTAATLRAVADKVESLQGKTVLILATDGGPNCNPSAGCDATKCIPNIERVSECAGINCCDAAHYGPASCLDEAGTRDAVLALAKSGVKTYVVGVPGSAPYADLLNQLAEAGGTARTGGSNGRRYYDVENIDELDTVLGQIGSTVVLGCHLKLERPPNNAAFVNVYLDRRLVPYGAPNGWVWTSIRDGGAPDGATVDGSSEDAGSSGEADAAEEAGDDASTPDDDANAGGDAPRGEPHDGSSDGSVLPDGGSPYLELDLVGDSCASLERGAVRQVQIVYGCPTDVVR